MQWFFFLARSVVWAALSLVFHIRYEGCENIPPRGAAGYILASNHSSYLDPVVLAFRVRPWLRFLAKEELMQGGWKRVLFGLLGIVPISRGAGDISAIERCAELTRQGYVLGIFPEGSRYPAGAPGKPKSGMAMIAQLTGADVLPCAVLYERPLRLRSKIVVRYGKLIAHEQLGLQQDSHRGIRAATHRVWDDVLALLEVKPDEA